MLDHNNELLVEGCCLSNQALFKLLVLWYEGSIKSIL